ncbi:MAG: hypothetical protein V1672_01705 [Candidatus Diapherotrites archaeon]
MVDDLLTLPFAFVGMELLPNYFTIIFNAIYKHTLEEMYPLDKINDAIKENRMLYEFDELTTKEYEATKKQLMEKLEMAKKVRDMDLGPRLDILGIGG